MQTVMGVQEDIILYSVVNRDPVQSVEDGGDVLVFSHPHQDPGTLWSLRRSAVRFKKA